MNVNNIIMKALYAKQTFMPENFDKKVHTKIQTPHPRGWVGEVGRLCRKSQDQIKVSKYEVQK